MSDMTANEYKNLVDLKLSEFFNPSGLSYDGLLESMHYSLTAGGKRIRPTLLSFAVSPAEILKKPFRLRAQ